MVLLIMAVLAALAIRPLLLGRSLNVTTAGNQVMEDLAYARELAIANNQPVEVWFLRPNGGTLLTGLQLCLVDSTGNSNAYGGVFRLPAPIGIDSGTTLSPLFNSNNKKTFGAQPFIPGYGTNYDAWFMRFMPDGSPYLKTVPTQIFLTLHDVTPGDQLTTLPTNYAVISIDPVAGSVSLYRP